MLKVTKQPANGATRIIARDDYPHFSLSDVPVACKDKKMSGIALDYTPARNFAGDDELEFQVVTKTGEDYEFKVPITVEKPAPSDDM